MIFDRVIGPALRRIGDLWHEGVITVAQEHLASQVLLGTLIDLLRLSQPADSSRRVALACFAEEDHVLGLYGAALRFASWGFKTMVIGARTPPSAIARVVESLDPDVIALSVTVVPAPSHGRELVDGYADACRSTPWIVGGAASASLRPWIEARGGLFDDGDPQDLRRASTAPSPPSATQRGQKRLLRVRDRRRARRGSSSRVQGEAVDLHVVRARRELQIEVAPPRRVAHAAGRRHLVARASGPFAHVEHRGVRRAGHVQHHALRRRQRQLEELLRRAALRHAALIAAGVEVGRRVGGVALEEAAARRDHEGVGARVGEGDELRRHRGAHERGDLRVLPVVALLTTR